MLETSIQKILDRHHILRNDHLLAGISGGPDSVALLNALVKLGMKVAVAHFNHQLRPSAEKESEFVRSITTHFGLQFFTQSADIRKIAGVQKRGLEETARSERYKFLFSLAKEKEMAAVLTAHHADDQVETIIFNLARGSGLSGLIGMQSLSFISNDFSIPLIRPLLDCWKRDILAYCEENHLAYVIDESNMDTSLTRNFIRCEIIPSLEKINPKLKLNILQTKEILEADHDLIAASADKASRQIIKKVGEDFLELDIKQFIDCHVSIQRYLLKKNLTNNFYRTEGFTFDQIEKCRLTLLGEYASGFNQITDNLCVLVEGGSGFIAKSIDTIPLVPWPGIDSKLVINASGSFDLNEWWVVDVYFLQGNQVNKNDFMKNQNLYIAYLSLEKTNLPIIIRSRIPGDTYSPMGMNGKHTKLSDCFINRKIPRRFRENWPLFCAEDGQIIWVPGFQPSHSVMIDSNTTRIIKMEIRKKD